MLDGQKLFGKRTTTQLAQVGELAQKPLSLLFEVGVIGRDLFHIVVSILQLRMKNKEKHQNPLLSRPPAEKPFIAEREAKGLSSRSLPSDLERQEWERIGHAINEDPIWNRFRGAICLPKPA